MGDVLLTNLLKGTNLYLIGMMGVGKSTVGQHLAAQLGYRFLDTDRLIEQTTGQSISDFFAEQGEAAFRDIETQVLAQLAAYTRLVVATGGGIVLKQQNWSYLQYGAVVWLDAPIDLLVERLTGDRTRPLLQAADLRLKLETLLSQRQAHYAQADVRVEQQTGERPDAIATRTLEALRQIVKSVPKPVPETP
jgi:shikimate kinase